MNIQALREQRAELVNALQAAVNDPDKFAEIEAKIVEKDAEIERHQKAMAALASLAKPVAGPDIPPTPAAPTAKAPAQVKEKGLRFGAAMRAVAAAGGDRAQAVARDAVISAALPSMQAMVPGGVGGDSSSARGGSRWWLPFGRDARATSHPQLGLQRGASRELIDTNPIAGGAVITYVNRVVGTGLACVPTPQARILGWSADQAAEWTARTKAEFSMWADTPACDWHGEHSFYELQRQVAHGAKGSGDIFTLLPVADATRMQPYRLRLQLIEADRVGNPSNASDTDTVAAGIRLSAGGAPTAAHIYNRHPGATLRGSSGLWAGNWVDYTSANGRRRLLHHYRKTRPGQVRGVPWLAPVVELIKQIGRFTDAEVNAAVISAFFTVFIETPGGNPSGVFAGQPGADSAGANLADEDIGLGMGSVVGLNPGEKATFANPARPNPNAEAFINAICGLIGMALGIPRELLIKQFNSSYSASKAALLDAWVFFRSERFWLAGTFCQPTYETWLAESVAIGRIQAPGFFADPLLRWAYTRCAWPGDSMGSINPKDEVAAYTAAIEARLMTRERAEWELWGSDFNETLPLKAAEEAALIEAGIAPVAKAGAPAPAQQPTQGMQP